MNKIKIVIIKNIVKGVFSILMILIVGIGIRVFVMDIYFIPSSSMENTLYKNDVILVNKLKYGPLLPRSPYEIPWINIFYYLKDNSKEAIQKKYWKSRRLSGTSTIKKQDILVFKKYHDAQFLVKRCTAIAGDQLKIIDGEIMINGNSRPIHKNIKDIYKFKIKNIEQFYVELDCVELNIDYYEDKKAKDWKHAVLTFNEFKTIKNLSSIDSLQKATIKNTSKARIYPRYFEPHTWTLDNYGPIIIPKQGMGVDLKNFRAFTYYQEPIRYYENSNIKIKNKKLFLKDSLINKYNFKQDYFFMMGDNRSSSFDSRYIGFIPENKVIGKVECIIFSYKDDRFQWDRLLKFI